MSGKRVGLFDTWVAGYPAASVAIYQAGTTTLASVYYDEDLSEAAPNPITLLSMSNGGVRYGKFSAPIYVGVPYEMTINSRDQTGVIRPGLTSLDDEDASDATVLATGANSTVTLAAWKARVIDVEDWGAFLPTSNAGASAATNTTTLSAAIGEAAANGGGAVIIPPGAYAHNAYTLSEDVIIVGPARDATVLQCSAGSAVCTIGGDRAGFANITLDGVSKVASSVGIYTKANDDLFMQNVMVKRFVTGIKCLGMRYSNWHNLSIDGCTNGALLYGDNDASNGANGDEFRHNRWSGGQVSTCTTVGIELKYVDKKCWHNTLSHVGFLSSTGTALKVIGARWTELADKCWFSGNTTDLSIEDGSDTTEVAENSVVGFTMSGGVINSDMSFTGKCQDVVFDGVEFYDGTYTLTTVSNTILAKNCTEASGVTLAGNDSTQWMRSRDVLGDMPASTGVTTDAVSTEAWAYDLAPGERVIVTAWVVANGRNDNDHAQYVICQPAHRPGSTLAYDGQTVNFTLGATLTGSTSGATARIIADSDSGATGTLTLRDITGEFIDDETITDSSGGTALANGTMSHQNAALLGSITSLITAVETDVNYACIFGVTAAKVRVMVTGAASTTVEWTVSAQVVSG